MKSLLLSLVAGLALAGCSLSSVSFEIDNPTDSPLQLTLDGKPHAIGPHASVSVSLAPGEHRLHTQALGDVQLVVYADGQGGLINPTLSEYVVVSQVYADAGQQYGEANNEIDLDGVAIEGPFTKVHGLFIEKDWRYGAHENFPDSVVTTQQQAGIERRNKLFSAVDFIAYLEKENEEPGSYLAANPAGYRTPEDPAPFTPTVLPALHPQFEAHAAAARQWHARYLAAIDPSEQKRLKKESFKVSVDFVQASAAAGRDLRPADHEQRNAFQSALGQATGMSAAVRPASKG